MAESSVKAPILLPGFKFDPNDLGLVRRYLRNKVDNNEDEFLTELEVYDDVPWLLKSVDNPLFKKKEWYYFVKRNKRGGKTPKRTVPGRGDSEGGTWKSTGAKTAIMDGNKKVYGYKQSLVFNKKVNGKPVKTDWLMTEYSLNKGVHDDTVLCWIRDKTEKKGKPGFDNQVPQVANNILPNQVQEHEVGLTVSASGPEMMYEGEHADVTQQQHQYTPNVPHHLPTQVSDFETLMHGNNNNNVMMTYGGEPYQQPQQYAPIVPPFLQSQDLGFETMMHGNNNNNVMTMAYGGEHYQYQPQQQYAPIVPPILQGQDLGSETMMHGNNNNNNNNNVMMMTSGGEQYQYQHPQEYTPIFPPVLQSQDLGFEAMMHSNNNIVMRMMYEEELYQQQQQYAPVVPHFLQGQDLGFESNNNNVMMTYGGEQYQQPQQDTSVLPPLLQSQDSGLETMVHSSSNNNNNVLMTVEGEQYQHQQRHDDILRFDGSDDLLFDMNDEDVFDVNELLNTMDSTPEEDGQEEEAQEQPQQLTPLP